jgi:hypothetical protein
MRHFRDYSYGYVIGTFFIVSLVIFVVTGWFEYVAEQAKHDMPTDSGEWANLMLRDMMENWQSEFLQLLCQVGLLTWLLFKGSPQSRDQADRMERKLDEIRSAVIRPNIPPLGL